MRIELDLHDWVWKRLAGRSDIQNIVREAVSEYVRARPKEFPKPEPNRPQQVVERAKNVSFVVSAEELSAWRRRAQELGFSNFEDAVTAAIRMFAGKEVPDSGGFQSIGFLNANNMTEWRGTIPISCPWPDYDRGWPIRKALRAFFRTAKPLKEVESDGAK